MAEQIAGKIKSGSTLATNKVTLVEAFFTNEKYRRASWIAVIQMAFVVQNGFNPIASYANNLYGFFLDDDTFLNPR